MIDRQSKPLALAERLHRQSVKARLFGRATGTRLDRYVVLSKLGEGGMGAVFVAHDPSLDRKVAIKLLHQVSPAGTDEGTPRWVEALEQEARSMARLSHPNVVHVYEVGEHEGQRYLAMELVEGPTLRTWQHERRERLGPRRAVRAIVAMYVQAGRGLAAAHRVGLVHRDFKPDNVLVDDEGRARVCDFGLARVLDAALAVVTQPDAPGRPGAAAERPSSARRTAVVGTPAYMAPEQLRGAGAAARSDQFAFCVALHEALEGQRPFEGGSPSQALAHVLDGKRRPPARRNPVPRWLRRVCDRGLAVDPDARWPSMDALVDALATGRRRARVRTGLAAALVLATIGGSVLGHRQYDLASRTAACERSGDEIEHAWSDERQQALRDAIMATGASHAAVTADKVMPWLDRQAAAWRQARVEVCLDTSVRGRWDAAMHDRAQWCMDERRLELESLVDQLLRVDATVLHEAVPAAASLRAVDPCRNERVVQALAVPRGLDREAIAAVRAAVARSESLLRTGQYGAGVRQAREALTGAEALRWPPLAAAARLRLGALLERTGAYVEAEGVLEEAYFEAAGSAAPELAVDAATQLVFVVGYHEARHADGQRWGRLAELGLPSLHDADPLARARLLANRAIVLRAAGSHQEASALLEQSIAIHDEALGPGHPHAAKGLRSLAMVHEAMGAYDRARMLHERALALDESALGPEHPHVAADLANLAGVHQRLGDHETAKALSERALAIEERALGPEHPTVAKSLNNLANAHRNAGDYERARVSYARALAIGERSLGPEHPTVARFASNLAATCSMMGDYDEALALHRRALDIHEKALGPEHPDVAASLVNLASVHQVIGAHEQARSMYERALAVQEQALGPEHPDLVAPLVNLGDLHLLRGDDDEARAAYARALAVQEHALGPEHPSLVFPLVGLARLALAAGRPSEAVPLAQRAVTTQERGGPPELLASARFVLACALWDAPTDDGGDRARAVSLAEQAREALARAGEGSAKTLAEVETWLREREPAGAAR